MSTRNYALKDLGTLVAVSVAKYNAEFIWQDVKLTDEFKNAFASALEHTSATVVFFDYSAVVTTSKNKQIFVPNQWFVIASYVIDLCQELKAYQSLYFKVADAMSKDYEDLAKELRGGTKSHIYKNQFIGKACEVISDEYDIQFSEVQLSSLNLWRFCTDYQWWAGQKTIDRGDFMNSTILSILNLVAASQGFVADLVSYYIEDESLLELLGSPDDFTENIQLNEYIAPSSHFQGFHQEAKDESTTFNDGPSIHYGSTYDNETKPMPHRIVISRSSIDKFSKK